MRFLPTLILAVFITLVTPWAAGAQGAPPVTPDGPTAAGLNLIYFVSDKWAMYGAPQEVRLSREAFDEMIVRVRDMKFPSAVTQVVVIMRDSDVDGTIGLIEKRGLRAAGAYVGDGSTGPYDVWHNVGYTVTTEKIIADFHENILAAESVYRDLPVNFIGTVGRVTRDDKSAVYVEFTDKSHSSVVACYPWAEAPQRAAVNSLRNGDRVRVSGQFTEFDGNTVKLRGCLFSR
ncbi:OB-fold putative lipoprotein [Deltaproteobacteria bacterium OttesenSCG-928-K17]|nr:OB-fold putative lipoprotein [Deltaproteobacteria bacterium OttesenSCG-928-K17]